MAVAKRNPQLKKGDWNHPFDHRRGCSWIFTPSSNNWIICSSYFHQILKLAPKSKTEAMVGQPWSAIPSFSQRQSFAAHLTAGDLAHRKYMVLSERMDSKRTNFLGQFFRQSHIATDSTYMVSSGRRLAFEKPFFHLFFSAMSPCAKNHSSQATLW